MVEIHFPDGGYYKGNMTDGVITGQGDYQSAFNEGNSITNGGSAMDTKIRTPSTISRLNQRATVDELQSKMVLRNERLGGLTEDSHQFKKAMVPRLREINNTRAEHLTNAFNRIRPTDKEDRVRDQKVKIAMSDFEEALERQRFLKYDLIWQRAENAFIQKKKSSLE
eukprot:gene30455-39700_t